MRLEDRAVLPLRACIVVLFAIIVLFQTMSFPGQFRHMAEEEPDLAYLRWPLTAATIAILLCVQVVLVCTWKLLGMVRDDRIFTEAALPWVDSIIAAIAVGWLVLAGILLGLAAEWDDPGAPLVLTLLLVTVAVIGLLMIVMRALLRQATTLRTDMEAVI
ncbi:MAG: hypothetical protein CL424_14665 [Acidimicrobiaceae bacterium]|nr:hypothetical protein [Acidimicrobiaceae bacterium]